MVYHAKSFIKDGDRHLDDILKKLPGIKVSENGSVSYQGKAINKFYIEGKDLLGMNYNQATKNMPVNAVADIEVLENHQPIKMLENKQVSDKAALNIKLDNKHKMKPFGEMEASVGNESAAIWKGKIFATEVSKKSQTLVSGKMNNMGEDLSDETSEHIDVNDLGAYEHINGQNINTDLSSEEMPSSRYVYNKSYSLGVNHLVGLSKNATLRCNIFYYKDHSNASNLQSSSYWNEKESVNVVENNSQGRYSWTLLPILKYELNSSKGFLTNELRYSLAKNTLDNVIVSNGNAIGQSNSSSPQYVQNYMSFSYPMGKNFIQGNSFVRYFCRSEQIASHAESASIYDFTDCLYTHSFVLKNSLSTSLNLYKGILDIGFKENYRKYRYQNEETNHRDNLDLVLFPSYTYRYGRENYLTLDAPIKLLSNAVYLKDRTNRKQNVTICPNFFWKQYVGNKLRFTLSYSYDEYAAQPSFLSTQPLRVSYRSYVYHSDDASFCKRHAVTLRLGYKDLASMFFTNMSLSYSNEQRATYEHLEYSNEKNVAITVLGGNHYDTWMADFSVDKTFCDWGVSLKWETNYMQNSYLLSQGNELTNNHSNTLSNQLSIDFQKLKWFRFFVAVQGQLGWENNSIYTSEKLKGMVTNLKAYVFPCKKIEMVIKWQYALNEITKSKYKSYGFLDVERNFKLSKILELGIVANNLQNSKLYIYTENSGLNSYYHELPLRHRALLLKALIHF